MCACLSKLRFPAGSRRDADLRPPLPQGTGPRQRRLGPVVHRAQVRDEAGRAPDSLLPDQQLRVRDPGAPRLLARHRRAHLRPGGDDPRHAPPHAHARPRGEVHRALPGRQRRADPPRAGLGLRLAGDLLVLRAEGVARGQHLADRHVVRQLPGGGGALGLQSRP